MNAKGNARTTVRWAATASTALAVVIGALGATSASADDITNTGSVVVPIPAPMPEGSSLTVTINGQTYDVKHLINGTAGGTLTLEWAGAIGEPQTSVAPCSDGSPGAQILLDETTPEMTLHASWVTATKRHAIGPIPIPSRNATMATSLCVHEGGNGGGNNGNGGSGGTGGNGGNGGPGGGDPNDPPEPPPCANSNGNGNGNAGGNGGGKGNGGGNGNGNAYGHVCN